MTTGRGTLDGRAGDGDALRAARVLAARRLHLHPGEAVTPHGRTLKRVADRLPAAAAVMKIVDRARPRAEVLVDPLLVEHHRVEVRPDPVVADAAVLPAGRRARLVDVARAGLAVALVAVAVVAVAVEVRAAEIPLQRAPDSTSSTLSGKRRRQQTALQIGSRASQSTGLGRSRRDVVVDADGDVDVDLVSARTASDRARRSSSGASTTSRLRSSNSTRPRMIASFSSARLACCAQHGVREDACRARPGVPTRAAGRALPRARPYLRGGVWSSWSAAGRCGCTGAGTPSRPGTSSRPPRWRPSRR